MPKDVLTEEDIKSLKDAVPVNPTNVKDNNKPDNAIDRTVNDRRLLTPAEIGGDGVLTAKAPRKDIYAHKQIGGGYDKTSGTGINVGRKPVTHATLRRVSKESGLISAIVSRREFQTRMLAKEHKFEGDLGFKIVHENHHETGFRVPEEKLAIAKQITQMFLRPWPMQKIGERVYPALEPNFQGFCSKYIKDLLIINRPCVEIGRGRNGKPISFSAIDGACVYPTFEGLSHLINPLSGKKDFAELERGSNNYKSAIEAVANEHGIDRLHEDTEWVYVNHGRAICGYAIDELMVRPIFPSTENYLYGYPPSMTENALTMIIGELQAMTYELSYFEFGTMVDTLIGIVGATGDEHIQDIANHLKDNHTGAGNAHKTPIVPMRTGDDIKTFKLKESGNDMRFGELLTTLTGRTCAIYGMNPEEINVVNKAGGGGTNFSGNRGQELKENKEEGLFSVRSEIKNFGDDIVKEIDPDLTFEWFGFNVEQEKIRRDNNIADLNGGKITIREARVRDNLDPLPEGLKDEDIDVFLNPQWVQLHSASQMMEQQQEQGGGEQPLSDEERDYTTEEDKEHEAPDFGEE